MRSGYTNSDSGGSQHHRHGHGAVAFCFLLVAFGSICSGSDRFVVDRIDL